MRHIKRSRFHEQTKIAINSYYCEDNESKTDESTVNEFKTDESKADESTANESTADESKTIQTQINEMWEERERQEQEEAARIKKEIDRAWAEYDAKNNADDFDNEDYTIEVEEYFQNLENIDEAEESESYEEDEPKVLEPLYKKDKKRSERRRLTVRANRRLCRRAENAIENWQKRDEDAWKNCLFHSSEELKLRVERCYALQKRAERLQR